MIKKFVLKERIYTVYRIGMFLKYYCYKCDSLLQKKIVTRYLRRGEYYFDAYINEHKNSNKNYSLTSMIVYTNFYLFCPKCREPYYWDHYLKIRKYQKKNKKIKLSDEEIDIAIRRAKPKPTYIDW